MSNDKQTWKVSWTLEGSMATVELDPLTAMNKAILEALGPIQSATVKKNGTLQFIMEVPQQPAPKPTIDRGKDMVRDSHESTQLG